LGGPDWFRIGDRDLGTHLERSRRLKVGDSLSQITHDFCRAWGIRAQIIPMSDQPVATIVESNEGDLAFQEYFVARACEPEVKGFHFAGVENAKPAPGLLAAIAEADLIIICPSNPWVSVAPILALLGIREALASKPVLAVSPIIGGEAVKGPAAKMYRELGIEPSSLAVAQQYGSLLSAFVLDQIDQPQEEQIKATGIMTLATNTLMNSRSDRKRLAEEVLALGQSLLSASPENPASKT
jgi:LPPG:FO 2-phospho-L-lactate transferase